MEEFLIEYREHIIWIIVLIVTVIILRGLTNVLHKWLLKKEKAKYPNEKPATVHLVKRILNALWLVLGIMAISFVFVDRDMDKLIWQNFLLVLYLGTLTVITIVASATVNAWFKRSIRQKISNQNDPTSYKFLRKVVVAVIYFIGILFNCNVM